MGRRKGHEEERKDILVIATLSIPEPREELRSPPTEIWKSTGMGDFSCLLAGSSALAENL